MSYFPRQKRQARTYWAELGFLALGLFALQPSLLSNLFSVPPNRTAVEYGRQLYAPQTYPVSNSQNWLANSLGSNYVPAYLTPQMYGAQNLAGHQSWPPQNTPSMPNPTGISSAYYSAGQFPTAYTGQGFGYSMPSSSTYAMQQPQSLWNGREYQPSQSSHLQTSNTYAYPNTQNYAAAAYSGWPTQTTANRNWNNSPTNSYAGSSTNPFNSLTRPAQSPLFGNSNRNGYSGADSYLSGRTNSSYSPYPANANSSDSFTPYRPGNSLYR
jgi:hypothetical protein